ncbi:hypothetical protein ABZ345_45610 [Lentzea sp. NPDC005914]|uniref:hypothetical protein n=1 Tax=Lentzea sp. NPDC005914 TaxID=3154572 RepID=UPI0033EA91A8
MTLPTAQVKLLLRDFTVNLVANLVASSLAVLLATAKGMRMEDATLFLGLPLMFVVLLVQLVARWSARTAQANEDDGGPGFGTAVWVNVAANLVANAVVVALVGSFGMLDELLPGPIAAAAIAITLLQVFAVMGVFASHKSTDCVACLHEAKAEMLALQMYLVQLAVAGYGIWSLFRTDHLTFGKIVGMWLLWLLLGILLAKAIQLWSKVCWTVVVVDRRYFSGGLAFLVGLVVSAVLSGGAIDIIHITVHS